MFGHGGWRAAVPPGSRAAGGGRRCPPAPVRRVLQAVLLTALERKGRAEEDPLAELEYATSMKRALSKALLLWERVIMVGGRCARALRPVSGRHLLGKKGGDASDYRWL